MCSKPLVSVPFSALSSFIRCYTVLTNLLIFLLMRGINRGIKSGARHLVKQGISYMSNFRMGYKNKHFILFSKSSFTQERMDKAGKMKNAKLVGYADMY